MTETVMTFISRSKQLTRFLPLCGITRLTVAIASILTLTGIWANPASADPFRTNNPRQIGDQTEAAFRAMFEQGNYPEAAQLLQNAESNEPLAYALKASIAYIYEDYNAMGENARLTRETAEQLMETDPLRGNLYIAAGLFLEGGHTFLTQGAVRATPTVLSNLQQVFNHLGEAEKIDPNDPELNLLKGYMDLILSVNLPFSNPEEAIQRLQNYAAPIYVAQRGIALGYRDLDQQDQALTAIDQALQAAPNNPELLYLKAQILRRKAEDLQGTEQRQVQTQSLTFFRQAWTLREQLPEETVEQIDREACRTFQQAEDKNPDDCGEREINWQRERDRNDQPAPPQPTPEQTQPPEQDNQGSGT